MKQLKPNQAKRLRTATRPNTENRPISVHNMVFDKDKGGNCDSLIFGHNRDPEENLHSFIIAFVKGSFKLSPDLMIYRNFKSYVGGIVEKTNDKVKEVARGIRPEEVQAIHACMVLSGIQLFSENLGLDIRLPELKTIINNA